MSKERQRVVAMIPARSGSIRVRDKNVMPLAGHPLIAYSIRAAIDSGVFDAVIVATDSDRYARIARHYGAEVPFLRDAQNAQADSPDAEWVKEMLTRLQAQGRVYDCFSILRPTSPFRLPDTIRRAWHAFREEVGVDSLRAVEKCSQHPCKMWVIRGRRMLPLIPFGPADRPWHSSQYPTLPEVFVQNASLEIAWTRVVLEGGTIAGEVVMPFLTEGMEGFDINRPLDVAYGEAQIAAGEGRLPTITLEPYID